MDIICQPGMCLNSVMTRLHERILAATEEEEEEGPTSAALALLDIFLMHFAEHILMLDS